MHWFVEGTDIGWVGCYPDLVRERRVGRHSGQRSGSGKPPPSQGTSGAVDMFQLRFRVKERSFEHDEARG